ncbi:MAG: amidohydrolase family protein [Ardenticatenaceae bacterium]|nr:amidohydrolase family protein [Ardenticatenaceae bacterium]
MRTVIRGGTLIDGTGRAPVENGNLLIDDNRIQRVDTARDGFSQEAVDRVIDASGQYIVPGIINCHDHLEDRRSYGPWQERITRPREIMLLSAVRAALVSLQEGITTVRDAGGFSSRYLKHALELGLILGPRFKTCIRPISQSGGHGVPLSVEADGPDEVRKTARKLLYAGADFIKCMASGSVAQATAKRRPGPQLSVPEMRAAFEEAHKVGRPTTVHAHLPEAIEAAIEAGVDAIEHGLFIDRPTADLMAKQGIYLVTTLGEPKVSAQEGREWRRPAIQVERAGSVTDAVLDNFRHAIEAGVKIAIGTDVMGQIVYEMKLMAECGMSPMDVIVSATRRGAEILNLEHEIGTLEAGKAADILILAHDPLQDLEAYSQVKLVIKDGKVIDPAALEQLVGEPLRGYLVDHGRLLAPREFPV